MSLPRIILGGVPIVLHAGAPEESDSPIGGETVLRMSDGAGQKMTHWQKMAGSISGQGWMPPGLDGLDYSGPLELLSTQVCSIVGAGTEYALTGTPRPDVAPWAEALVGDQWVPTGCVFTPGTESAAPSMTITPVASATLYKAAWLPQYIVLASRPQKTQSGGTATHGWAINWEEA